MAKRKRRKATAERLAVLQAELQARRATALYRRLWRKAERASDEAYVEEVRFHLAALRARKAREAAVAARDAATAAGVLALTARCRLAAALAGAD